MHIRVYKVPYVKDANTLLIMKKFEQITLNIKKRYTTQYHIYIECISAFINKYRA